MKCYVVYISYCNKEDLMFGISSYAFTRPSKIQSNKLNCKKSVNIYCFRFAWSKLRYAKKQGKILFHTKRPEEKLKIK